ncbi:MAG: hypothetical protein ACFB0C_20355 [Leptolyngbyaceae cyanobacterium]
MSQGKLTKVVKLEATTFMATCSINRLPRARIEFEKCLPQSSLSPHSRTTYGNRVRQWLAWAEQAGYWPGAPISPEMASQCAPPSLHGHGSINKINLTSRRGIYKAYALRPEEMNPELSAWYEKAQRFLTRPNQPGRTFPAIAPYTIKMYTRGWCQILGWQHRYNNVPLAKLGPQHLFPVVDQEEWEELSPRQQDRLWRKKQRELEEIICGYRDFLLREMRAFSPHTWHAKLVHMQAAGRILYSDWVTLTEDYNQLPVFKTLRAAYGEIQEAVNERQQSMETACLKEKWPEVPPGRTALEVFQQGVLEPMRQDCRPRTHSRKLRSPRRIAHRYQQYLRVAMMGWIPPLRQQVDRSLKIALSCPITRPASVPVEGCYYPIPPDEVRERGMTGKLTDNFLHHTYELNGQPYPEGIWVREVQEQKTRKSMGIHRTIIPNRRFADRACLYDYVEQYLEGVWWPQSWSSKLYQGTNPRYQNTMGNWVSAGRSEFNPEDTVVTDVDGVPWRVGFLFVSPKTGLPYSEYSYLYTIQTNAHRLIGKAITPHTMRYLWATWAYQEGLSDTEVRSLAFMMGHKADTLRRMYVKVTPTEQQRPIEDAIMSRLCRSEDAADAIPFNKLIKAVHHLSQEGKQQLMQHIEKVLDKRDAGESQFA